MKKEMMRMQIDEFLTFGKELSHPFPQQRILLCEQLCRGSEPKKNGIDWNGMECNGMKWNRMKWRGWEWLVRKW